MWVCGSSPSPGVAPLRWRRNGWLTDSQSLTPPISWNQVQHSYMNISMLCKRSRPSEGGCRDKSQIPVRDKFHSCICPNDDRYFWTERSDPKLSSVPQNTSAEMENYHRTSSSLSPTVEKLPHFEPHSPPLDGWEGQMESLQPERSLTGCCPPGWSSMFQSSYWLFWTLIWLIDEPQGWETNLKAQFCWIPCPLLVPSPHI